MLQLSRDEQPCVYHEFHLCVLTKAKLGHDVMVDVPVKVLSPSFEFKKLRFEGPKFGRASRTQEPPSLRKSSWGQGQLRMILG